MIDSQEIKHKKSIYDLSAFEIFLKESEYRDRDIQRLRRKVYKDFVFNPSKDLVEIGDVYKNNFIDTFLALSKRVDSKIDGASKLLLSTADGYKIETVILRIKSGRVTLCVSSQVGCTEKCEFCATAQLGFLRNLTTDEILDQVRIAATILAGEGLKIRNIVFMGMGEPLRNYKVLKESLIKLTMGKMFAFALKNITVSTSGIAPGMTKLSNDFPDLCIALSLNASCDEQRSKIMPINNKYPIMSLREALEKMSSAHSGMCLIEYILFEGFNDTEGDVYRLASLLKGLSVHINLISYNSSSLASFNLRGSSENRILKFQKSLQSFGFIVTRRYSLGQDIFAACGQLANKALKI